MSRAQPFVLSTTIGSAVELEVTVRGTYHAGSPGRLWGPPEDCYESEPSEVEVTSVTLDSAERGSDELIDLLNDATLSKLAEWCCERLDEDGGIDAD